MLRIWNCCDCFCILSTKHSTYQIPINFPSIAHAQIPSTEKRLQFNLTNKFGAHSFNLYIFIHTHTHEKLSISHLLQPHILFSLHFFERFWFPYRYSVQEKIIRNRTEEERYSIRSSNKLNANELYDPNQNKYYKMNNINNGHHLITNNGNGNNVNGNGNTATSVLRERYQHPALVAIINEAQGIKFRGE